MEYITTQPYTILAILFVFFFLIAVYGVHRNKVNLLETEYEEKLEKQKKMWMKMFSTEDLNKRVPEFNSYPYNQGGTIVLSRLAHNFSITERVLVETKEQERLLLSLYKDSLKAILDKIPFNVYRDFNDKSHRWDYYIDVFVGMEKKSVSLEHYEKILRGER